MKNITFGDILSKRVRKLLLLILLVTHIIYPISADESATGPLAKIKQVERKMDWLRAHGENIWVGRKLNKTQINACRQDEYNLLYLRDWGIARLHYTKPLLHCPQFFKQSETEIQNQVR